jgi:hypothetical protein
VQQLPQMEGAGFVMNIGMQRFLKEIIPAQNEKAFVVITYSPFSCQQCRNIHKQFKPSNPLLNKEV